MGVVYNLIDLAPIDHDEFVCLKTIPHVPWQSSYLIQGE